MLAINNKPQSEGIKDNTIEYKASAQHLRLENENIFYVNAKFIF